MVNAFQKALGTTERNPERIFRLIEKSNHTVIKLKPSKLLRVEKRKLWCQGIFKRHTKDPVLALTDSRYYFDGI